MAKARKDPFDVDLSDDERKQLATWLEQEITKAWQARAPIVQDGGLLDYWHFLYETGRPLTRDLPWPKAANLGSYIPTEKVDALRARMMKTIFVEPVWVVEGWGDSARRAPLVEEFHQWKLEEERLQGRLGSVIHNALIEGTGVLEVTERVDRRIERRLRDLQIEVNDQGQAVLNDNFEPTPLVDEAGGFIDATGPEQPQAKVAVAESKLIRRGPSYRVCSLRDFMILPGHAQDDSEIFAYCKRFWRRMPELKAREKQGIYQDVDEIGTLSDRDQTDASLRRAGQSLAEQDGDTAEKELWEVLLLKDLDGDGLEEWYVATIHCPSRTLLRLKHDDLSLPRYMLFRPFPRPNSVYGYAFMQKQQSIAEEHAALRNQISDRGSLKANAPIKRHVNALWDPDEQPFGPRQTIDVRDMNEVQPFDMPDVPESVMVRERQCLEAAERMSGLNDVATGVNPQDTRTLGEVQLVAEQSFVRMEESIRYCQEAMEDLFQIRHELWRRALEADPMGLEASESFTRALEFRGMQIKDGRVTAADLAGTFRGKPRGSVETADKGRMRGDFNGFMSVLAGLAKAYPPLQQIVFQPETVRTLLETAMRLYNITDRQAFLGPLQQFMQQQQQAAEQAQMMAAMGMPPTMGMPPGAGPAPGPGPIAPGPGGNGPAPPPPATMPGQIGALMAGMGGPGAPMPQGQF